MINKTKPRDENVFSLRLSFVSKPEKPLRRFTSFSATPLSLAEAKVSAIRPIVPLSKEHFHPPCQAYAPPHLNGVPLREISVKIFNLAGVPIGVVGRSGSNEVRWYDAKVHAGLYVYLMEVSRRAKTIDVVIKCDEQHLHRLQKTCFWFFRRLNELELKSPEDALDLADYMTIVSRAYGLLAKQEDEVNQLPTNATVTIVCSVRPRKLLDDLQAELQFFPTSEPGIYLSEQRIEERIIVSTELDVIEKNYPLLILAKGKKLLEFFEEVVMKGLTEYVEILLEVGVFIDPETLIEGVRRMAERHHELTPGLKRALENWFEDYPQHIHEMAPIRRVLEEERINAKREDLILLLESKFGSFSEEIASQLEAMRDVDELTQVYKRALYAKTLEEVGVQKVKNA